MLKFEKVYSRPSSAKPNGPQNRPLLPATFPPFLSTSLSVASKSTDFLVDNVRPKFLQNSAILCNSAWLSLTLLLLLQFFPSQSPISRVSLQIRFA